MKRIISASYKDDTPAFESEEFFKALARGYSEIPNKIGTQFISLRPEDVYCFVFWTKNPSDHFLMNMHKIKSPFYFQWTVTGYGPDMEPYVPNKDEVTERFRSLSERIGKDRVIWRYDPILLNERYTIESHMAWFERTLMALSYCVERCVISFIDLL